ncbi:MAG TPA: aminoglycoside phosphotransferase family protein [Gemmatimonadales bacterium]|nr:aminoglycoside phosphotransferase family protein [Gemmatimonadales bacterium]
MRLEFKASREQRASLRAQRARLEQPTAALAVLGPTLPADDPAEAVACGVQSVHPDRFVLRARVRTRRGQWRSYALKAYADDFCAGVWAHAQALAACREMAPGDLCLPIRYVARERLLVFPWVDGRCLSDVVEDAAPELFRRAARLTASLHRLALAPEPATTPEQLVALVGARCERLRRRCPEGAPVMEPLVSALAHAASALDPAEPALVHGDLWAGHFLWSGEQLVLLDLDAFGYTDPAYDVGHFLAQAEREALVDPARAARADLLRSCFLDAYRTAMPTVSSRNIAFYRALTLTRKIPTLRRIEPARWPGLAAKLAGRARAALEEMATPAGGGVW